MLSTPYVCGGQTHRIARLADTIFEKVLSVTGSMASTLGALNPFRYRGYYYDVETGLYYLKSRYYNPEIGRYLNADILLEYTELYLNILAYCNNNPICFYDPDGYTVDEFIERLKEMFLGGGNVSKQYHHGNSSGMVGGIRNPHGRKGGPAHQNLVNAIVETANGMLKEGYSVTKEFYVKVIIKGYKTKRFGDLGIHPREMNSNSKVYVFQVGRATIAGSPVAREVRAISDIESKGYYVIFIPYNN